MKGDKFHFLQNQHQARECPDDSLPTCNGTNGVMGEDCCGNNLIHKKARECPDDSLPTCNGTNGVMGEDCCGNNLIHKKAKECPDDSLPTCNGTNGVMGEDCCGNNLIQLRGVLPTCNRDLTVNCQPVCDETNTVGCTEADAPIPPPVDRFEGKWTHEKPSN